MKIINYGKQYLDNKDYNEVKKVLKLDVITRGKFVNQFEKKIPESWVLNELKKIFSNHILLKYLNYEIEDSSFIISALSTHLTTAVTSFINILKIILSSFICLFILLANKKALLIHHGFSLIFFGQ